MENVLYKVIEKNENNNLQDDKLDKVYSNLTIKQLKYICGFYDIDINKKTKNELIKKLIKFENNKNNLEIVETRKRLFDNLLEIKNNKYLSKYIFFNW